MIRFPDTYLLPQNCADQNRVGTVPAVTDPNRKRKISIIIPAYNEESRISLMLEQIKLILKNALLDYEVLVINDGSIDETDRIVREIEKLDSHVRLVSYKKNVGKGHAVKLGVLKSEGDVILFLDGDLNISPNEITSYSKEIEGYDLAIASKAHPESVVRASAYRRFLSNGYNNLLHIVLGIKIKDTQSGLKIGDADILKKIFEIMLIRGYAFDVELLTIATMLNLKIKELPIRVTLDSSFEVWEIIRMFIDTLKISYRLRISKYYNKRLKIEYRKG